MKGYLPIRTSTLKKDQKLGFDLFIQLPHKLIHYIRSEDDIEESRLKNLKKKKVRKLYIQEDDEDKYQIFIDRCLETVMNDDSISIDEKSSIVVGASEATAERIMEDPNSKKSYNAAHTTATNLMKVLANDEILKGIFDHQSAEDSTQDYLMQKYAVNTSSLCISFAESLGVDKETIEFLGVAGLFHDVGYTQYEDEYKKSFFKRMDELTADQMTKYKEHPLLGARILQDKEYASETVIDLILVHEERVGGNGFPEKKSKLDMIQQIIGLCSYYNREVTIFNRSRDEVYEDMAVSQLGNFDLELIKKFKAYLKKTGLN
jgi:HD-GYP domain-containing protein (c-di-GMP phosphodiesterase class II)